MATHKAMQDIDIEVGDVTRATSMARRPEDGELRVLIFTACYFVLDGVTLTIRRLEGHMRQRGASVKILTTAPDDLEEEAARDIIIVPGIKIPFTAAGTGYKFGSGLDENTMREIEKFKPNLIHFTVPDLVALDGIKYCHQNKIAYMATWHSNYQDYLKYYFLDWVLKYAFMSYMSGFYSQMPALYAPTPFMKEKLEREGFGQHTEIKIWGRGVDLELFSPLKRSREFRAARGIGEHEVVVLWVGRLVPEKRPEIWMNVLHRLRAEGIPYHGLVVGHGAYEGMMATMHNVSCTGWLSGEDLAEAYASADILLFPSAVETFGNVTLEALASGCVCIVEENCSGHLVSHGENGFCCPAGDFEKFYEATAMLVKNHDLRAQFARSARESAWRFERGHVIQQMLENYKDMIVMQSRDRFHEDKVSSGVGDTWMRFLCCDYFIPRRCCQPILGGLGSVQEIYYTIWDAVQGMQLFNCMEFLSRGRRRTGSDQADVDKKTSRRAMTFYVVVEYIAILLSWMLVLLFLYISFRL